MARELVELPLRPHPVRERDHPDRASRVGLDPRTEGLLLRENEPRGYEERHGRLARHAEKALGYDGNRVDIQAADPQRDGDGITNRRVVMDDEDRHNQDYATASSTRALLP